MPKKPQPKREGIMLAYPMDTGKLRRLGKTAIVQPKLNGERCRIEWFRDDPVLLSSYNNPFEFCSHIKKALVDLYHQMGIRYSFDGELYHHGWPFSRIHSAASCTVNYNPDNEGLQLHIFDLQIQKPQEGRSKDLMALAEDIGSEYSGALEFVPTHYLPTSDWELAANHWVDRGYEGIILRKLDGSYVPKRTVEMLKFKPTEPDEYTIMQVLEAISKDFEPKGMVGAFLVMDTDGNTFKVGAGKLKHPERIDLWKNREHLIGRKLVVKHEKLKTSGGVPVCAVAVKVL
ncbi:MAG: hypothetical protein WCY49_07090 [Anaerovoracaceae bacterium]